MKKIYWLFFVCVLTFLLAGCDETPNGYESSQEEPESVMEENIPRPDLTQLVFEIGNYRVINGTKEEGSVIITSREQTEKLDFIMDKTLWPYEQANQPAQVNPDPRVLFSSLWKEKYTEEFFRKYDLLLYCVQSEPEEGQHEAVGFEKSVDSDEMELCLVRHLTRYPNRKGYTWLITVEVEKGVYSGTAPMSFPKIKEEDSVITNEAAYFQGEHGVVASSYLHTMWPEYRSTHYGVVLRAPSTEYVFPQGQAILAWWNNGFVPVKAVAEAERVTATGQTVRIGYGLNGDWLWVDFMHPSGCYGAHNQGLTGKAAQVVLETVLNARLGN